jgi:hypothetical protein
MPFLAEGIVSLIVYYVVFMIIGDFAAYFLGLFTEYEWGSQASLIVFLALFSFPVAFVGACGAPNQAKNGRTTS